MVYVSGRTLPRNLTVYDKIGVIQQSRKLEQLYRALTQRHTQKLANMVVGEWWKVKR